MCGICSPDCTLGAVGRLAEEAGPAPQRCVAGGAEYRAGCSTPVFVHTVFFPLSLPSAVVSLALLERWMCRVRAQVCEPLRTEGVMRMYLKYDGANNHLCNFDTNYSNLNKGVVLPLICSPLPGWFH